ncbi:MAG TPA: cytochrome c biogenesis protein CcsA [Gemmatimonadaceae bacterium]|nr:cytochrome c biogenesis protein CcsA [Gemmatimonadaceae bacterium]
MTDATQQRTAPATEVIPPRRTVLGWAAFAFLAVSQLIAVRLSPPDRDMGHLQKIMYVHVPAAWSSLIAVVVVAATSSVLYLWKREEKYDLLAASAAEVGVVLMSLTIILGSIWGRPTWGTWWAWDARLTSMAVLLLIFIGYLALRAATDDEDRRARWSAAVAILGAINAYVVYMSVRWWRTLHQIQSSPATVDPAYVIGLRLNAIAFLLLMIYFVSERYRTARLERATERALEDQALSRRGGGEGGGGGK